MGLNAFKGQFDSFEGFRFVSFHHQFAGIQPGGADALGLEFGAQDGGGKDFAVGHLLFPRGLPQV